MSDKKLYLLDDKASLGASDLVYSSSADGSSDGKASWSQLRPVIGGVLSPVFAAFAHTHSTADVSGLATVASTNNYNDLDNLPSLFDGAYTSLTSVPAAIDAIDGLTPAADRLPYYTGASAAALATFTAAGRALVDDADAAAQRTTLGLGAVAQLATVTEADQTLADNTTNNVSITKHGYAPKAPNDATKYLDGTGAYSVPAGSAVTITGPQGRLSLTSGVAVMIADATAQGTVYYVPYTGKYLPIYSGSAWSMLSFGTGVSLALNSTDNLIENLYDIWCYSNTGTATLGTGPAWINTATITVTIATPAVVSWTAHGLPEGAPVIFTTTGALPTGITAGTTYYVTASPGANSFNISTSVANAAAGTKVATSGSQSGTHTGTNHTTVRGTGSGTTELELKDGIWTNKNAVTLRAGGSSLGSISANQATYLGTIYCTANGQTGMAFNPAAASNGSNNILGLFNAYNRVPVRAMERDSTVSWTYASTTWQAQNASVLNRISWVDGLQQLRAKPCRVAIASVTSTGFTNHGTSLNATNVAPQVSGQSDATITQTHTIIDSFNPTLGFNYAQSVEARGTAGTMTSYGTLAGPPLRQSALFLDIDL